MRRRTRAVVRVTALAVVLGCSFAIAATRASSLKERAGRAVSPLGHSQLLLWPAGPPQFGALPGGGPGTTVVVADLASGRHTIRRIPGIAPGDFPVPLLPLGHMLVYNADRGVSAVADDLRGRPRLLGRATYFVPGASSAQVLLIEQNPSTGAPRSVRRVALGRRSQAAPMRLPAETAGVVEGTRRGLLLVSRSGWLELWRPGGSPRPLGAVGELLAGAGVAADARVVVYASRCRNESATSGFVRTPVGYEVPAPAGTLGWVPRGFGAELATAPGDRFLAAEAGEPPSSHGQIRLFVIRLGRRSTVTAVPSSLARLYAGTAWSTDGFWLLYQGPGERLRALDVNTGATRTFAIRCCRYTAMVATPTPT
jgi:hypothetical protein